MSRVHEKHVKGQTLLGRKDHHVTVIDDDGNEGKAHSTNKSKAITDAHRRYRENKTENNS